MINKVILLGRLGKDPEVRYLDNGKVVCNCTLATNDTYTDKNGNKVEQTEWHNLEMWDNIAKTAEKYLQQGTLVYIEGKIKTDNYTDREGHEKSVKKIRVLGMQIVSNSKGGQRNESRPPDNGNGGHAENDPATHNHDPLDTGDLPF